MSKFIEAVFVVQGYPHADFSPRNVRRAMRRAGADVRKAARRLVARRAISAAGQYPGKQTGELQKAIQARVSRSGWSVRIASYRTAGMERRNAYYPAFLVYGAPSKNLAKRRDYVVEAFEDREPYARQIIEQTLLDGVELK